MRLRLEPGGNRGRRSRAGGLLAKTVPWLILVALAGIVLVWWTGSRESASSPTDIAQMKGEPIVPLNTNPAALGPVSNRYGFVPGTMTNLSELAASNATVAEVTGLTEDPEDPKPSRRQRPKPGSYPKRMMDYQMRLLTEGKDPRAYDTNILPDDFILTNLPPPKVEGYEAVSFGLLAGYEFELRPEVVRGAPDGEAAGFALDLVPPEVRALNGRKVAVSGFLLPMRMDEGLAVEFLLMRDQTLCCFGRVPRINEWISVRALGRGAKPRMDVPITVCGLFTVSEKREKGTLIGLYQQEAEKIIEPD